MSYKDYVYNEPNVMLITEMFSFCKIHQRRNTTIPSIVDSKSTSLFFYAVHCYDILLL